MLLKGETTIWDTKDDVKWTPIDQPLTNRCKMTKMRHKTAIKWSQMTTKRHIITNMRINDQLGIENYKNETKQRWIDETCTQIDTEWQ